MTDRIHPSQDTNGWRGDPPSAPPLHGSAAATAMPEKAIRKEQEVGLISRYDQAQARQHDDHIYAAPAPVYHSSGVKGHADERYGMVAAAGARRRRQRSPCCCCLLSFAATLGTLILIAGIAALVLYLVLRPIRKPKFTVEGIEVREFNLTNGGAPVLNTQMELYVQAENPNKKIGIDYSDITVEVYYDDAEIGEGSIPGFYQGHRSTTVVTASIEGRNVQLTSAEASALGSDASVWLDANVRARARVKVGRWRSRRRTFHLLCSLELSSSPHLGNLTVLSSSCKLQKPKFRFLGIRF